MPKGRRPTWTCRECKHSMHVTTNDLICAGKVVRRYYKCVNCAHQMRTYEMPAAAFEALAQGSPATLAALPRARRPAGIRDLPTPKHTPPVPTYILSPCCNTHSTVKWTERRPDGYYRRHKCNACGSYHFTQAPYDGTPATLHRRLPPRPAY